jgi:hypothetical protein
MRLAPKGGIFSEGSLLDLSVGAFTNVSRMPIKIFLRFALLGERHPPLPAVDPDNGVVPLLAAFHRPDNNRTSTHGSHPGHRENPIALVFWMEIEWFFVKWFQPLLLPLTKAWLGSVGCATTWRTRSMRVNFIGHCLFIALCCDMDNSYLGDSQRTSGRKRCSAPDYSCNRHP